MRRGNEIRFRIWDGNEMMKVSELNFTEGTAGVQKTGYTQFYRLDRVSLMQSTGIKRGDDFIYEGDLISIDYRVYLVALNKGRLELVDIITDEAQVVTDDELTGTVVGNIHENKDTVLWAREKGGDTVDLQGEDSVFETVSLHNPQN